jgi:formylmethanofuran dehydrogenase subunit E
MGTVAIRCTKCGEMRFYKGKENYWKDFQLDGKRPVCNKCHKKKDKK